jgi:inosine-uridine nucleoside N-ribohydrolase
LNPIKYIANYNFHKEWSVELEKKPIPVILDTDIGDDIDDTWAVSMLLRCPELDVKLVTTDMGKPVYRGKLIAKMLEIANRTDIAVALGPQIESLADTGDQAAWVEDYELEDYPGMVYRDGADAIIRTIGESEEPVTIICIGPLPTVAQALHRDPSIAGKAHFVGMHGSFRYNFMQKEGAIAEYNVCGHIDACRTVFAAPWLSRRITPLDTCGSVQLDGKRYAALLDSNDLLMKAVLDNYRIWCTGKSWADTSARSTVLFDTVAVHLAYSTEFCVMKESGVEIDNKGMTLLSPTGPLFEIAMDWADREAYHEYLVERLLMPVVGAKERVPVDAGQG